MYLNPNDKITFLDRNGYKGMALGLSAIPLYCLPGVEYLAQDFLLKKMTANGLPKDIYEGKLARSMDKNTVEYIIKNNKIFKNPIIKKSLIASAIIVPLFVIAHMLDKNCVKNKVQKLSNNH